MPALTSITVQDRESTPVDHTFIPDGENNGVFRFTESDGVPVGDNTLTIAKTVTGAMKRKVRLRLALPQVASEVINGVSSPKVVRTAYADLTLSFDAESTTQERENAVGILHNLLDSNSTLVNSVVTELEGLY